MNPVALSAVLSAAAGASLGVLGGGGSVLSVPILLYAAHLSPKPAITLSLLVVGATSAAAAVPHARAGNVRWNSAIAFGIASMVGAAIGGGVSHQIPGAVLLAVFTSMMVVTGLAMLRKRRGIAHGPAPSIPLTTLGGYGLGVGALTGLVGAGGGFVIVPALALLGGLPMPAAIGTSLVIIAANSLTGFAAHLGDAAIDAGMALALTMSSVAGSLIGASVVHRIRPELLRKAFGVLVLALAAIMTSQQLRHGPSATDHGSNAARVVDSPRSPGG